MKKEVIFDVSNFPKAAEFINAVLSGEYRVIFYGGAIRGGKTFNCLGGLTLLHKLYPHSRSAIIRKDLETLKRNTLPSCEKVFPQSFIKKYLADNSGHTWRFNNGSTTFFFSENYDKDKELNRWNGLEVNFILLEQVEELQRKTFDKALERVGSYVIPTAKGKQPPPVILANVNPTDGWVRELVYNPWLEGKLPENWLYIPAKITDNPFIPESFKESLKELKKTNPIKYQRFVEGDWDAREKEGDEYYPPFDRAMHVGEVEYLINEPVHLCYDFNSYPYFTEICTQVVEKPATKTDNAKIQIRVFREYCLKSPFNTAEGVCKAFLTDYGEDNPICFYYGDATGKNRITGLGDISNYDLVEDQLIGYLNNDSERLLRKNPNPLKRRDLVLKILRGDLDIELLIDESCSELIKDFEKLKLGINGKNKTKYNDKEAGVSYELLGHTTDALEGLICYLWESLL